MREKIWRRIFEHNLLTCGGIGLWAGFGWKGFASSLIMATVLLALLPGYAWAETGGITGRVVQDSDGQPVADLWISACHIVLGSCGAAKTQLDGTYSIHSLASGNYRVYLNASGTDFVSEYYNDVISYSSPTPVAVTAGQTTAGIDFGLAVGGAIAGMVTRESDGMPVSGVWVHANLDGGGYYEDTPTQPDGTYRIRGLVPGTYHVDVSPNNTNLAPEYYNNVFDSQAATPVEVTKGQTTADINFSLAVGATISGVVTSKVDGQPVADVYLYAGGQGARTQADGSYTITNLPPGSYDIVPYTRDTEFLSSSSVPVAVSVGQGISGINFGLAVAGKITGVVTRDPDGLPVADLQVKACPASGGFCGQASTRPDGTYIISGLASGDYEVHLDASGTDYISEYYNDIFSSHSATPVVVATDKISGNIDFRLAVGGAIAGVVIRDSDGQPVSGVEVYAGDRNATTQANGAFTIEGLAPGNYLVHVNTFRTEFAPEYYNNMFDSDLATPVEVNTGQTTADINFRLAVGGKITGVVTRDSDNQPVSGVEVYAGDRNAMTQADGAYTIEGLVSGNYSVQVYTDGTAFASAYYNNVFDSQSATKVEVTTGQTIADINFRLPLAGRISGIVTRAADGQPVAGLWVTAIRQIAMPAAGYPQPGGNFADYRSATTQIDGTYIIEGLAPGSYIVDVLAYETDLIAQYYNNVVDKQSATPVVVTAGQTSAAINFQLVASGKITGVVTRASDGQPLAGVWVYARGSDAWGYPGYDSAVSQADGSYTIKGLIPDSYTVQARASWNDLAPEYFNDVFDFQAATPVAVSAGQTISNIDFTMSVGGKITGVVTRMADGQPVSGLSVYAGDQTTTTQADGSYTLTGLASGNHYVWVNASPTDFVSAYYHDAFEFQDATPVTVDLGQTIANIDFQLAGSGKIAGVVTDAADGLPVGGIWVAAADYATGFSKGSAETKADGSYSIEHLSPGAYRVQANPSGSGYSSRYFHDTGVYGAAVSVNVEATNTASGVDFQLAELPDRKGNINNDAGITLQDTALALKLMTGGNTAAIAPVSSGTEVNGDSRIGMEETLLALQRLAGLRDLPPLSPVIDGMLSPGEWDDAESAAIQVSNGWTVTVFYKNDAHTLYLAFTNLQQGNNELTPEVMLDIGHEGGLTWDSNDWGFTAYFNRNCEAKWNWELRDCTQAKLGWTANTVFPNASGTTEMALEYEKLGLIPGQAKRIGIAFEVWGRPGAPVFWPVSAKVDNPSTWGTWSLQEKER